MTNNFLHSLFRQCNVTLNVVAITQASEHYHYRSYLETLLTYCTDAAASQLTNAYCYLDRGDMLPCDPTAEILTVTTKRGFITHWNKHSASKVVELFGPLHMDLYNVHLYLLPGFRLHIRLTKARSSFYMMKRTADSKPVFKFLDA